VAYADWQIRRWETPASDFGSARRELLRDDDVLIVILQCGVTRRRVQFTFTGERIYQNINETYLSGLWAVRPPGLGATWHVESSDFWRALTSDPLAAEMFKQRREYVFLTEDDVIQVISVAEPRIDELAPADPASGLPGLSDVYYKR
jgi:hypothetical protein